MVIPAMRKCIQCRFLMMPGHAGISYKLNRSDFILNVLGFFPLGFIVMALLSHLSDASSKLQVFLAAWICMIISLNIEIVQGYRPSRNSAFMDLFANTIGGTSGATAWWFFMKVGNRLKFITRLSGAIK